VAHHPIHRNPPCAKPLSNNHIFGSSLGSSPNSQNDARNLDVSVGVPESPLNHGLFYAHQGGPVQVSPWTCSTGHTTSLPSPKGRHFPRRSAVGRCSRAVALSWSRTTGWSWLASQGRLQAVRLRSEASIDTDLAFFSSAHHPRLGLAEQFGCEVTEGGCLLVHCQGRPTSKGLYAAGDITASK
jgi:hypothetical protein